MGSSLAVNGEKIQRETAYPGTVQPYPMQRWFHLVHLRLSFQASDNENTLSASGNAADVACAFATALSAVSGDDMHQAVQRVNLSETLSSVSGLPIQNGLSHAHYFVSL